MTIPAEVVNLKGCNFNGAIFGKLVSTDTANSLTDGDHDFSGSTFVGAKMQGYTALSKAKNIMNDCDFTGIVIDDNSDFSELLDSRITGSRWGGISAKGTANKLPGKTKQLKLEKLSNGLHYGVAPWADMRNYDFSDHYFTQALDFGNVAGDTNGDILRASALGQKMLLPNLKAGEYIDFGGLRVTADADANSDFVAYSLAYYGVEEASPKVTQAMIDKVNGVTNTITADVHAAGSIEAYQFWMQNLAKAKFTGTPSSDYTLANVLAATSTTARVGDYTENSKKVTIKKQLLVEPAGLLGNHGDKAGHFQITGTHQADTVPVAGTIRNNASDPRLAVNDALYAAVKVDDFVEIHGSSAKETVIVTARTDATASAPNYITVTRGTGAGADAGGAALNLSTGYAAATGKLVIRRSLAVTAATGGRHAIVKIQTNGQKKTNDDYTTANTLGTNAAGVMKNLVVSHNSLINGMKMDRYERLTGNAINMPTGKAELAIFSRASKYTLYNMIGPDQDLTHLKDHQANGTDTDPLTTAFDLDDAILNDVKLGAHGTSTHFKVDISATKLANNVDFRRIQTGAMSAMKEAAGANFDCAIIGTATSGKSYGVNWYAKGIKGKLDKTKSGYQEVNNLYTSPAPGIACTGAFYGPGADLRGETLSGDSSSTLDITASMEDTDVSGLTLQFVKFSAGAKNANFEGATFIKVELDGDITGANFKNINATGTSAVNRGLDLSGATALTATSVMPDFSSASLEWASMPEVTGSSTNKMKLTNAKLQWAIWTKRNFQYVDMEGSNLSNANFQTATTTITGVSWKNANLTNLKFKTSTDGDLTTVEMDAANLDGANITGMDNLTKAGTAATLALTRLVNMTDETVGADRASVQAKFASGMVTIYKNSDGKFVGLPGTAASPPNLDISELTLGGTPSILMPIDSAQKMTKSKMTNFVLENVDFQATSGTAMSLEHNDDASAGYLTGFHIKNAKIAAATITCVQATAANTARTSKVWDTTNDGTSLTTEVPSGAATGTTLMLHGTSVFSGIGKTLATGSMSAGRMVGGKNHVQDPIDHSGANLSAYDAAGIMGADLSNNTFAGAKYVTDPGASNGNHKFSNSTLPTGYKAIDNYVFGPSMIIGASGANVQIITAQDFSNADLSNAELHVAIVSGITNARGANLSGTKFNKSNVESLNISGATVSATTDLSEIEQTNDVVISGRNIVGSFLASNLPTGISTTKKTNYVQVGSDLIGTTNA